MRRVNVFLAVLIASLVSLTALIIVGFYVLTASPYPSDWMSSMWGRMGGMMGGSQPAAQNSALPYFGVLFIVLIGVTVFCVGGLAYFLVFPEIKSSRTVANVRTMQVASQNSTAPYESVVKTLNDEERRVIDVLKAHDGKYLQKYIKSETGLSRLKTHRIVARLVDRGIVTIEKFGNTNEVVLANWLRS